VLLFPDVNLVIIRRL